MNAIDLDDENTLPKELLAVLSDRARQLKEESDKELKFADTRWSRSVVTPVTDSTFKEIFHIIEPLEIRAYHCTRLFNPSKILTTGLRLLTPEMHKEILTEALEAINCTTEEMKLVFKLLHDFQEKGNYKNREGQVCFILSRKMAEHRDDCEVFFKQVGGEATKKALSGQGDSILSKLSSIGTPVLVDCVLPIKDAADYQVDNLVKWFIQYGIEKFVEKRKFSFYCEMFVKHEVGKNLIQDVLEVKSFDNY